MHGGDEHMDSLDTVPLKRMEIRVRFEIKVNVLRSTGGRDCFFIAEEMDVFLQLLTIKIIT